MKIQNPQVHLNQKWLIFQLIFILIASCSTNHSVEKNPTSSIYIGVYWVDDKR